VHIIAWIDVSARYNPINLSDNVTVTKVELGLNDCGFDCVSLRYDRTGLRRISALASWACQANTDGRPSVMSGTRLTNESASASAAGIP
jgi:hypothetical protein